MLRKLFFITSLLFGLGAAGQSVGIVSVNITPNDTLSVNTPFSLTTTIANTDSFSITDTVWIVAHVDTAGPALVPLDSAWIYAVNWSPSTYDSVSFSDSVTSSVFKSGVNTVVIWPKVNNVNLSGDTFQYNVFIEPGSSSTPEYRQLSGFMLFPNPASDELFIRPLALPHPYKSYSIYDVNGRLVKKEELFQTRADISMLERGLYLVKIKSNDGSIRSMHFMKE